MSKARKQTETAPEAESVVEIADLLQLLAVPETENCYNSEIELVNGEMPDVIALARAIPESKSEVSAPQKQGKSEVSAPQKQGKSEVSAPQKQGKIEVSALQKQSAEPSALNRPAQQAPLTKQEPVLKGSYAAKNILSLSAEGLPSESEDSLERIAKEIASCTKCPLYKTRNKTVAGMGPERAKLVFIGEAPGGDEDLSGIPFVGKAGKHLDKILAAAKINKDEVYICNILKCRPPNNRDPLLSEMRCCTPFLQRQLRLLKPSIIACLGNIAVKYVIGPNVPGITRIHGQWFDSIFSIPAMAMYHPSYLIRSAGREKGSPNWQMWQDIQALKKRYDSVK